jgi:fatty acid desaturase
MVTEALLWIGHDFNVAKSIQESPVFRPRGSSKARSKNDTNAIAHAVRARLGKQIFEPATSRLLWVVVHLTTWGMGLISSLWLMKQEASLVWFLLVSLVLGMSFAGMAFVAHETLHGALTRNRTLRRLVGFVGFLPFCVSPRLWIAWHNRIHHGNTNIAGKDPDAYPDLHEYEQSWGARLAVQWGAPRSGKWRGLITLLIGFSLQSAQVLLMAKKRKFLSSRNYALAWAETLLGVSIWATLAMLVGLQVFVVVYLLPLVVANFLVMAHIVTNHSLSPLADHNDALETSLTVTVPRWFEFYSLGFGYHVEHHLFPAMSNRHAPRVQAELRRLAPTRYQQMPLVRALALLFRTPRVYGSGGLLVDPETGETWRTLGPARFRVVPSVAPENVLQEKKTSVPPPRAA